MRAAARGVARHAGIVLLGIALAGPCAAADASLEYAVKAAYLTKFVPFITWPDSVLPPGAPVTICVLGDGPFGGKLEQAAAEARGGDHAIAVRHVAVADTGCQLLFLGEGGEGAVEALRGKPVVTVTDSDARTHGVISFVIADNHVRFDIDDAAAQADGLAISSKLLGLAHAVKQRGTP